jgi:hypothetical protein
MKTATKALQTAKFLGGMYTERARVLYWAHVRGDLFSRLILPNDHSDPYQIYEEMRKRGPMLPTRLGNYSTTSHRMCNEVLRSRKFGVSPGTEAKTLRTRLDSTCRCSNSIHQITHGSVGSQHLPSPLGACRATPAWLIKPSNNCLTNVSTSISST